MTERAWRLAGRLGCLAVLAAAAAFPLVFTNPAVTTYAVYTLIFVASASAWNVFSGYSGYISLGHAVFFGSGAYFTALATLDWHYTGSKVFLLLLPAGLLGAILAVPFGLVALRVRRHTFVVITIAVFFIFQLMAYNLSVTHGTAGVLAPPVNFQPSTYNNPFYYCGFGIAACTVALSWLIRRSRFGLQLRAIRDDEDRARGLGVRATQVKLTSFVISAVPVAMVGGLWWYFTIIVDPPSGFDPLFDVAIALMAFLGGLGTVSGPVLGALIIEPAELYLKQQVSGGYIFLILYGALFLVVILILPRGIIPTAAELITKGLARRKNSEGPVGQEPPAGAARTGARAGISTLRGAFNPAAGIAADVAKKVADVLREHGMADAPIGIDVVEMPVLEALRVEGIQTVDGQQVFLAARRTKTKDEITLLTQACSMVDAAYTELYGFLRPGVRENECVGLVAKVLYDLGSEYVEGVNAISGERCSPHPHVFSDRLIRPGDPAFFDILHSHNGYRTCYYRTLAVGSASVAQRDAYTRCREYMDAAIALVKPGTTTADIVSLWPKAQEFGFPDETAAFALQYGHGVGLSIWEKPIFSRLVSLDHPEPLEEGMVFALETYWPAKDGWSAARIEEEVVVTADGCEVITKFPAEELLVAGRKYWTVGGELNTLRESQSHLNTAAGRGEMTGRGEKGATS